MSVIKLIREGLTPETALSYPVFVVMLFWNLLANGIDSTHVSQGQTLNRMVVVVAAQFLLWFVLWLCVSLAKRLARPLKGLSFLALLLSTAAVRGWLMQLTFDALGIPTATGFAVRIIFSVFYVGFGIVVAALWLHQIRQHNQLLETMFGEQDRLYKVKFEAEQKILEANHSLINGIKRDLLNRVDRIGKASAMESLAGIREAIDQVVRPLSQQLAYESRPWHPEPVRTRRIRVSWPRVIAESFSVDNIHPLAVTVAVTVLIAPSSMQILTLTHAWYLLLIVPVVQFAFLTLAAKVVKKYAHRQRRWLQATLVVICYAATGALAGMIASAMLPADAAKHVFAFPTTIYTVILGVVISLLVQARRAMTKVEQQLSQTTAEAGWQISRIRQMHRELEQSLANQLHGKIQGVLAAVYLKLARAITEDQLQQVSVDEFKDTLTRTINELGNQSNRPNKFDEAVLETRATWADVCQVEMNVSDELRSMIYADALLCHSIEDLLPELAFNAVKHGRATRFVCQLELTSARTVSLIATDNGTVAPPATRVGLGSKLLDECCISWTRTITATGTIVTAELPLQVR